jgi:hypothetical protein
MPRVDCHARRGDCYGVHERISIRRGEFLAAGAHARIIVAEYDLCVTNKKIFAPAKIYFMPAIC